MVFVFVCLIVVGANGGGCLRFRKEAKRKLKIPGISYSSCEHPVWVIEEVSNQGLWESNCPLNLWTLSPNYTWAIHDNSENKDSHCMERNIKAQIAHTYIIYQDTMRKKNKSSKMSSRKARHQYFRKWAN